MDVLFLLSAHVGVRLFLCRDTRPRVSVLTSSEQWTPRVGCPYDVNVAMHHFAGIWRSFWCVLRNGTQAVPYDVNVKQQYFSGV